MGPDININVFTSHEFSVTPGGVVGISNGAKGADGKDADWFFNDATDGEPGADSGPASVEVGGNLAITIGQAGVGASSIAGAGGNGGSSSIFQFGNPGKGGAGGESNLARVALLSGSAISTVGNNIVGVGTFSLGGSAGSGGNDSGFFPSPGGSNVAGAAGVAQVFTYQNSSITTNGVGAYGVQARAIGGGGGASGGGFGIFYTNGANGGTGGNGGVVQIAVGASANGAVGIDQRANGGSITTYGSESHGILAQSLGGGGGEANVALALFRVGATGGAGGEGKAVTVANASRLDTFGVESHGILAQSIGGGGGEATNIAGAIVLGGDGGGASKGGSVSVANFGDIKVEGRQANGIVAQSIGGGGGLGSASGGLISFGGSGGAGAVADAVSVTNAGNIKTGNAANKTSNSNGILAQSIGGGGGAGGSSYAVSPFPFPVAISLSFGGSGGAGADAGNVSVLRNTSDVDTSTSYSIETAGDNSSAIKAQSIGGGGGDGGDAISAQLVNGVSLTMASSGSGGVAGSGGDVLVQTKGSLKTLGNSSDAIYAQSVGGGGGKSGMAIATVAGGVSFLNFTFASGGAAGSGGDAGRVDVSNFSNITTSGDASRGIAAVSQGGGGGDASMALTGTAAVTYGLNLALGKSGGAGGESSRVNVENRADIITSGVDSHAIFAQSLAGGGGNSAMVATGSAFSIGGNLGLGAQGASGGAAGDVNVESVGNLVTSGDGATGISALSQGGGGGTGSARINVPIGFDVVSGVDAIFSITAGQRNGGDGNTGGRVNVRGSGAISTSGNEADGIFAQSIGGGGGKGGAVYTISANISDLPAVFKGNIALGASGGSGNTSEAVDVRYQGQIKTVGAFAEGVIAQSIGGGGGNGGEVVSFNFSDNFNPDTPASTATVAAIGGTGGAGNDGSTVSVALTAGNDGFSVKTEGNGSTGILAQSIGGGGGRGGFSIGGAYTGKNAVSMQTIGGIGGAGGNSQDNGTTPAVSISNTGSISTAGQNATAVKAQSIGGGGGEGGFAIAIGITGSQSLSKISSVGGSGGAGGTGASVVANVNNNDNSSFYLITGGDLSKGILAQSIGGGGGDGGIALGGGASFTAMGSTETNSTGGDGGNGNSAGSVSVKAGGGIYTGATIENNSVIASGRGTRSTAILAQSIGGGGGGGGFSGGLSFSGAGASAVNTTGGNGGIGSDGGLVDVTTSRGSVIKTFADSSTGIQAQSIGGGGGEGGFAISASVTNSSAKNVVNTIGGAGGAGGIGSNVTVTNYADISTAGYNSQGILAQSIGGGGGDGNFAIAGNLALLNGDATTNSVGGKGGGGQGAGSVIVFNNGNMSLRQASSSGIVAQSIGGGGGSGSISGGVSLTNSGNLTNNVGGSGVVGGAAGNGSLVAVTNSGSITTNGPRSFGILAESIGGGGGDGGMAFGVSAGTSMPTAQTATSLTTLIGGAGGAGGFGSTVNVINNVGGVITTNGDFSYGILALSVGGGGGDGGFATGGSLSLTGAANMSVGGGSGAPGGKGSAVTVTNNDSLYTNGNYASAILAQSIGGGGGNGGITTVLGLSTGAGANITSNIGGKGAVAGAADNVSVSSNNTDNSTSTILTQAAQSKGIVAQSIGGGGGDGGIIAGSVISTGGSAKVSNSVGGEGAAGNRAGGVTVNAGGYILTGAIIDNNSIKASKAGGAGSIGILAQSIGGGGGDGGIVGGLALGFGGDAATNTVGGKGGAGSDGGVVNVTTNAGAKIVTFGDRAAGVVAQSIGGGGGSGGFSIGAAVSNSKAKDVANTIGGQSNGGAAGNGGVGDAVLVANNASISTAGFLSHGLIAQSIGGGGGDGGFAVSSDFTITNGGTTSSTVGGSGGLGQNAGSVTVNNSGAIHVAQAQTIALIAQSIGGGGGDGGFAGALVFSDSGDISNTVGQAGSAPGGVGSNGAVVRVANSGKLTTGGLEGAAVLAQSIGGGGGVGGFAISGSASSTAKSFTNTIGGAGGNGGDGGDVTISNDAGGAVIANGALSRGLVAQSIGGGGGRGGFATAGNLALKGDATVALGAGTGGGGGNAGRIILNNNDSITTNGDRSIAVVAQSIGGGGGDGGFAGGLNITNGGKLTSLLGANTGAGGQGGMPNSVSVTNAEGASITTNGLNSTAILAQAIAGGGGNGGYSISGNAALGSGIKSTIGSRGGDGGAGSSISSQTVVSVTNNGAITTTGALSTAIIAESIGGGGGDGGVSISGAGAITSGGEISTSLGGAAGGGGNGGGVNVVNKGEINLKGAASNGIIAQSIGGGGGNSGFTGGLDLTRTKAVFKLGQAAGASGGAGGDVSVANDGTIATEDENSTAILAQSIDGGGGNVSWAVAAQTGKIAGFSVVLGGSQFTTSNTNGTVLVLAANGYLATVGNVAHGGLVQSIGGGGGSFAFTSKGSIGIEKSPDGAVGYLQTLGANGTGAAANRNAAAATFRNSDIVTTVGHASLGLVSQSIGGGGGVIGMSGNADLLDSSSWRLQLGSQGSVGGAGALSSLEYTGRSIATVGDAAVGIVSQSIGGGGGIILDALNSVSISRQELSISLGSQNSAAGVVANGGGVKLNSQGALTTLGNMAPAMMAQTIGGGGGFSAITASGGLADQTIKAALGANNGVNAQGSASADPGAASSFDIGEGNIQTNGALSAGLIVQAIGGGGGVFGFYTPDAPSTNIPNVTLGASASNSGAVAGDGAMINLRNQSAIYTKGVGAVGVLAQSIGGGGGSAFMKGVTGNSDISSSNVTMGGTVGVSGNGADIAINSLAPIVTTGTNAYGIVAQSIGGGGGLFMGFDGTGAPVEPGVTRNAGGNGSGGNITVDVNAPIAATGAGSIAVLAQSIGGGGGYIAGRDATRPTFAGSAGGEGRSGDITVNVNANITANGLGADAIFVQSSTKSGDDASRVAINIAPGVTVLGDGPDDLLQSKVNVSVEDALHTGAGVQIEGAREFTMMNYGTIDLANGARGVAIISSAGHDLVTNYGRIIGSYSSLGEDDQIINKPFHSVENPIPHSGVFEAGSTINLGQNGQFTNQGAFIVGAFYQGLDTTLTGNYSQTGDEACGSYGAPTTKCGYLASEIQMNNGRAGMLTVTGRADISGAILVQPSQRLSIKPGAGTVTVLRAEGGLTTHNLQFQAPPSGVAAFGMRTTANEIKVDYTVNYAPIGLTFNQRAPAAAVNAIQASGAFPAFGTVARALFVQPNIFALGAAYNSLSGEGVSASQQTTFMANDFMSSSANRQMNFWLYDQEDNGGNSLTLYDDRADVTYDRKWRATASHDNRVPRFAERTWRSWMVGSGGSLAYPGQASTGSASISAGGYGFAGGVDRQITPNLLVGVAGGYGTYGFGVQERQTYGNVYGGHVAGYAALRGGPFYATGVLSGDFFDNYAKRMVSIVGSPVSQIFDKDVSAPGVYDNLNGKFGSRSISGMGEAGYRARAGAVDVTPFTALQFSSLRADGFNEFNGYSSSVVALNYQGRTISSLPGYVGLQLNHNFNLGNGMPLWGWVRSAWRHEFDQLRSVTTAFMAAPGMNFTTLGAPGVRDMASVSSGVKLGLTPNLVLFAGFDGNFAPSAYAVYGSGGIQMRW